jgi:hypothetical protein
LLQEYASYQQEKLDLKKSDVYFAYLLQKTRKGGADDAGLNQVLPPTFDGYF